jgi:hypothetical protein
VIIEDFLEWVGDFVLDDGDVGNAGVRVDWLGRGGDMSGLGEEILRRLVSLETTPMPDCLDGRDEPERTTGAGPPATSVPEAGASSIRGLSCEKATPPTAAEVVEVPPFPLALAESVKALIRRAK